MHAIIIFIRLTQYKLSSCVTDMRVGQWTWTGPATSKELSPEIYSAFFVRTQIDVEFHAKDNHMWKSTSCSFQWERDSLQFGCAAKY